jgi:hypothetical protein
MSFAPILEPDSNTRAHNLLRNKLFAGQTASTESSNTRVWVVQDKSSRQQHNHWAGGPALLMERIEHTHCGRRFVDAGLDVPFFFLQRLLLFDAFSGLYEFLESHTNFLKPSG